MAAASPRPGLVRRLLVWSARSGLGRRAAFVLTIASILSGLVTYYILTRTTPVGPDPRTVVALLTVNFVLLLVFGGVVVNQLVQLWTQRRRGLAGSRLHVRLVILFSVVAIVPTVVFLILSYILLSVGMQSWFSEKVRTSLQGSRAVAQAYLEEHKQNIGKDALAMADDISENGFRISIEEGFLNELLNKELYLRSLSEAEVIDGNTMSVVGRSASSVELEFEPPPPEAIHRADFDAAEPVILTSQNENRVRALAKITGLPNVPDAILYVGRPIEPRVLAHMAETDEAVDQYERLEHQRSNYEISFILIFAAVALLLLLAAVWVGFNFATQISRRIRGLVVATERVRGGDLTARLEVNEDNDEFDTLSRAFNRMTHQLHSQQSELVEANKLLDARRRFTETVLSGVSAGVLGLDENGVINLPNRSASALLGASFDAFVGHALDEVVPEMAPLLNEARSVPGRLVEGQIRIAPDGRAKVLLVRIATEQGDDEAPGFVVTFDDITELLSAQRKAAWADVARRIAHEMKNPLTPIQLSAERLKRKYMGEIRTNPEIFALCTDTIIRQVGDIGRMVDEFSSFARMPTPSMKLENLDAITQQAVFLQRAAHPEMVFDLSLPNDPVNVSCDSRQISQALINLLQNAIDSIHARQVNEAGEGETEPGHIQVSLVCEPGSTRLIVRDNGKGLPKEGRENLTEPYVTTRVKGTGLGLAIVKKIMEDHGGELVLEDAPRRGARVSLVFKTTPNLMPARRPPSTRAEIDAEQAVLHDT